MAAQIVSTGITPAGTRWTRFRDNEVPGVGVVNWIIPTDKIGASIPVVLYTHGAGGGADQFVTLAAWAGIRDYLLDIGVAVFESDGAGTQPWANRATQLNYEATGQYAIEVCSPPIMIGLFRSMGGLVGQWLLTQSPALSPILTAAMINSGVQDLIWAYDSGNWTSAMNSAWGVSNRSEFVAAAAGADPMQFDPALWNGTKVLQLVGTADDLVPAPENGYAMRAHYVGRPAVDLLDVLVGGDHSTTNGSYLQTAAMVSFVNEVLDITPPAPDQPAAFYRVVAAAMLTADGWRRVTFRG